MLQRAVDWRWIVGGGLTWSLRLVDVAKEASPHPKCSFLQMAVLELLGL